MQCPKCKNPDTRVIDSRPGEDGRAVRRRRECEKCDTRFTTYERIEVVTLLVKKNDNTTEPFNREKLKRGIILACLKRPVSGEQIKKMIAEIEEELSTKKEISSGEIGEKVMNALKTLDHVAFIRFASVYRSFKDVEEFKKEISTLFDKKWQAQ